MGDLRGPDADVVRRRDLIRDLLDAQTAVWNVGDAKGWSKDFTRDSAFVNIVGARFENRDPNVLVREGVHWRIAFSQNTAVVPLPPPA